MASQPFGSGPIDRKALVTRHDIDWPDLRGEIPLGNGNFAINADGTGLETFSGSTMSHWCWHSFPLPPGTSQGDIKPWAALEKGRLKGPTTPPPLLKDWLYFNPHPLNLGRLGFVNEAGERLPLSDCAVLARKLSLWSGLLTCRFTYEGLPVTVETCVHPQQDCIAVRVTSALFRTGRLKVRLDFPSPSASGSLDPRSGPGPWVGDFTNPAGHCTDIAGREQNRVLLKRTVDATVYWVELAGKSLEERAYASPETSHRIDVDARGEEVLELTCLFSRDKPTKANLSFAQVESDCAGHWANFWQSGGAIDLSGSSDSRWKELERRIVLSQYHMAAQSAGDQFSSEVGLTGYDHWSAKFHLEMTWWHVAHFALWNRWSLAEKALGYYRRNASLAREIATNFGYRGLMWPKSTGPDAINDGWPEEMALMWKQPHPIFFAELEYRQQPTRATLEKWAEVVSGTAEMMADYPTRNPETGIYSIDPCWPACEGPELYADPVFELAYWRWALETAQQWRVRLGLKIDLGWDNVLHHLAPLPVVDGVYAFRPNHDDYVEGERSHVDSVAVFATLPLGPEIDPEMARRTLLKVAQQWNWESVWGWDFPLMAMGAARVGEANLALDALFNSSSKNRYDERGLNRMTEKWPYLPGNGGLLYAVAMMAAGWDSAPDRPAPGFPADGSWVVRHEGLNVAP